MASSAFAALVTILAISTTGAAAAATAAADDVNDLLWSWPAEVHCCPCAEATGTDDEIIPSMWIHYVPHCCRCPTHEPSPSSSTTLPMTRKMLRSPPPPHHSHDGHHHHQTASTSPRQHSDDCHGHHHHHPGHGHHHHVSTWNPSATIWVFSVVVLANNYSLSRIGFISRFDAGYSVRV